MLQRVLDTSIRLGVVMNLGLLVMLMLGGWSQSRPPRSLEVVIPPAPPAVRETPPPPAWQPGFFSSALPVIPPVVSLHRYRDEVPRGGPVLYDPFTIRDRERVQPVGPIMDLMGFDENDTVIEIGTGYGFFTIPFARRVARVIAVDPDPLGLAFTVEYARRNGVKGRIEPLVGAAQAVSPGEGLADAVFFGHTYHVAIFAESDALPTDRRTEKVEVYFGRAGMPRLLRNIHSWLRPGGVVGIVDAHEAPSITTDDVRRQMEAHGFTFVAQHDFMPNNYFLVFRRF